MFRPRMSSLSGRHSHPAAANEPARAPFSPARAVLWSALGLVVVEETARTRSRFKLLSLVDHRPRPPIRRAEGLPDLAETVPGHALGSSRARIEGVIGFTEAVRAVSRMNAQTMDRHWMPRWALACVDLVSWPAPVKVEEFDRCGTLREIFGEEAVAALPRLNETGGTDEDVPEAARRIIARKYARDYRPFGDPRPAD